MNRREIIKLSAATALSAASSPLKAFASLASQTTAQYDIFECTLRGPTDGNPFIDISFTATFRQQNRTLTVDGFYTGNGVYKVRFMPDSEGIWSFTTSSMTTALNNKTGSFLCIPPTAKNHGPVAVHNTHHFAYADGTPYFPFGTTCYAWAHQGNVMEEQTLTTLAASPC